MEKKHLLEDYKDYLELLVVKSIKMFEHAKDINATMQNQINNYANEVNDSEIDFCLKLKELGIIRKEEL